MIIVIFIGWPDPSGDKAVAKEQRGECHCLRQTQQRGENNDDDEKENSDLRIIVIVIRAISSRATLQYFFSFRCLTWRLPSSNASPRWRTFYQKVFLPALKIHFPQVEKLIQEMKTANLESLTISPPEESKAFLDGETSSSNRLHFPPILEMIPDTSTLYVLLCPSPLITKEFVLFNSLL